MGALIGAGAERGEADEAIKSLREFTIPVASSRARR